jgi:hypothetical protein
MPDQADRRRAWSMRTRVSITGAMISTAGSRAMLVDARQRHAAGAVASGNHRIGIALDGLHGARKSASAASLIRWIA